MPSTALTRDCISQTRLPLAWAANNCIPVAASSLISCWDEWMQPNKLILRAISLLFLGLGLFQIITSLIALFFCATGRALERSCASDRGDCVLADPAHHHSGLEKVLWRELDFSRTLLGRQGRKVAGNWVFATL